jgi:hypothetical protein
MTSEEGSFTPQQKSVMKNVFKWATTLLYHVYLDTRGAVSTH